MTIYAVLAPPARAGAAGPDARLEVSRRVARGGQGGYRADGREVRARDLAILFADAATGAHSPALVRQGQVAELITARPRDRRRILEEAEGRLRAAEGNLERLGDVVLGLETRAAGLKRQARRRPSPISR